MQSGRNVSERRHIYAAKVTTHDQLDHSIIEVLVLLVPRNFHEIEEMVDECVVELVCEGGSVSAIKREQQARDSRTHL